MSFILDALKKLEQKRNQDSIPNVLTVHAPEGQKPQKRLTWPSLIVIALCINAAILLAWLKPWQSEKESIQPPVSSERTEQASAEPAEKAAVPGTADLSAGIETTGEPSPPAQGHVPSLSQSAAVASKRGEIAPPSEDNADSIVAAPDTTDAGAVLSSTEAETSGNRSFLPDAEEATALRARIQEEINIAAEPQPDEPAEPDTAIPGGAVDNQELIDMSQLPSDIQNELPKISLNTHIYSNNPASRVVNINGIVLREGDDISRGLTLQEITTYGVILTFKEYRFRIRAF